MTVDRCPLTGGKRFAGKLGIRIEIKSEGLCQRQSPSLFISSRSTVNGQRPSAIGHRSSAIGHRSSAIGHRSSAIGHRSSAIEQTDPT
ncbi:hypothetical protein [Terrimonas ginsenosidimutans]|uniref:hypothetical protein n=1 Tax=Terrimonas ginsenosidimutans TaxID=2908004 RepID=UPI003D792A92